VCERERERERETEAKQWVTNWKNIESVDFT
jgi:hypothetical protein